MKNKTILCFLAITFLLLISACSSDQPTDSLGSDENIDPTFQFQQQVRASGKVILSNSIELSFPISGQVVELEVDDGDIVSEGDILAMLDTSSLEQEIAQRESDLAVARANLARVLVGPSQADLLQAESDLVAAESFRPLNTAQRTMQAADIAAAQAYLDYLNNLPLKEDVDLAQSEVDRAKKEVEAAMARMERATLKSPINGNIIELLINSFEYVQAGRTIILLSDVNDLSVVVGMDEVDAAKISMGDDALVTFEALPGVKVRGLVTRISPISNTTDSRNFNVELKLLEIPEGLRWGMSAEATFE